MSRVQQLYQPPAGAVRLLHVDEHILVAAKPPGLLSVPGRGEAKADCLEARLQDMFPGTRAVHRLDMETSGLMVLARTREAHRQLSEDFASRRVVKSYLARVAGRVEAMQGEIDLPIIADWPNRPIQKVDHATGKPSLTRFEQLSASSEETRLKLVPLTGRTHQLRVHLAKIGHPILGDSLYAPQPARQAAKRLMLHAWSLAFIHPATGAALVFTEPAPF